MLLGNDQGNLSYNEELPQLAVISFILMTFIFDSGARLQREIRSCSGATSFPVVRSKAPNFVGEPINPKTIKKIKKKDV